ncbi:MAG: hypothetical protein Tsb005_08350 [Gammaproteobacteria bacterium]
MTRQQHYVTARTATLLATISSGFLLRFCKRKTASQHIRGSRLVSLRELTRQLRAQGRASTITLGGVPIIKHSETQHFFIHGTVGSGKSVCLQLLLQQIRRRKQRAVIYDKGDEFARRFYRSHKDILLNPLDA